MNEENSGINFKAVIEALLFVSEKPLTIGEINEVLDNLDAARINEILRELKGDYENENRGIRLEEIAGGFQLATSASAGPLLRKFYKQRDGKQLSKPSLETLAIIAYKQPLTRLDIESFRGVNADGVVKNLLEKGLIKIAGRKDVIGRPFVYGTTRQFLEYFGLNSLSDLPKMEDFSNLPQGNMVIPLSSSNRPQEVKDLAS